MIFYLIENFYIFKWPSVFETIDTDSHRWRDQRREHGEDWRYITVSHGESANFKRE